MASKAEKSNSYLHNKEQIVVATNYQSTPKIALSDSPCVQVGSDPPELYAANCY